MIRRPPRSTLCHYTTRFRSVHVGTVDSVAGDRIKLTKADSGSHRHHHHYLSGGMVAAIEDNKVRLSATGANAALIDRKSTRPNSRHANISYAGFFSKKQLTH